MIRKDIRLGFAFGGVALAVIVVYVLTASDAKTQKKGATIADGTSPGMIETVSPDAVALKTSADKVADKIVDRTAGKLTGDSKPITDEADKSAVATNADKPDANSELWKSTLDKGVLPVLMTETPSMPATGDKGGDKSNDKPPVRETPESTVGGTDSPLVPIGREPAAPVEARKLDGNVEPKADIIAPPLPTGSHTHVVQKGETLAKIAAVAYGNSNYYPHILRANPGIDPARLKPGMTINLPAADDVVAKTPPPTKTVAAPETPAKPTVLASNEPLDPKSQYRVEAGDSLFRISMKLYGTGTMVDKIYDMNKEAIGADRAKLKLHSVLKLPETPTQATASR